MSLMELPDGITTLDGFVAAPEVLFTHLVSDIEWDAKMAARKTASFGVPYNYSQMSYPSAPFPAPLEALRQRLQTQLGPHFNNCLVNLYPEGSSSMGFHSDDTSSLQPGSGVAIVSLGFERSITFRSKADEHIEVLAKLPSGSLLYMNDDVQSHWMHAIERVDRAEPRMSLTWRAFVE